MSLTGDEETAHGSRSSARDEDGMRTGRGGGAADMRGDRTRTSVPAYGCGPRWTYGWSARSGAGAMRRRGGVPVLGEVGGRIGVCVEAYGRVERGHGGVEVARVCLEGQVCLGGVHVGS